MKVRIKVISGVVIRMKRYFIMLLGVGKCFLIFLDKKYGIYWVYDSRMKSFFFDF